MCAKLISWVQRDRYVGLDVCGGGTDREETREGTTGRGKSLKKKEGGREGNKMQGTREQK